MYAVMLFPPPPESIDTLSPSPSFFFRVKNRVGSFNKRLVLFTTVRHQAVFKHTANKLNVFLNHQFDFPMNTECWFLIFVPRVPKTNCIFQSYIKARFIQQRKLCSHKICSAWTFSSVSEGIILASSAISCLTQHKLSQLMRQ